MKIKQLLFISFFFSIAMLLKYYMVYINPSLFKSSGILLQSILCGIGPFLGGLILIKGWKRPNDLSFFKSILKQEIVTLLIPIVLFALTGLFNGTLNINASKIVLIAIFYAFLEEYGWRGYLQSELKGINTYLKYFIISILWFIWHLEFDYSIMGYLILLAGSFGMGYVADKSKSLIYVALFHAFINILATNDLQHIPFTQKLIIILISAITIIVLMIKKGKSIKMLAK